MWHILGAREVHAGFWLGNLRERIYFEDLGINGKVALKWIFKQKDGGVRWIDTVEDNGKWRDDVNGVMYLGVAGNFLTH